MKKTLLSALFIGLCLGSFAQSLSISNAVNNLTGPANTLMIGHASVTNTGSGTISVKVLRTQNDTAAGHSSFFCWNTACFPATTNESPFFLNLNPGDIDTTLEAKLDPLGHAGQSVVTYCFYDMDNPSDSTCVTFNFNATPVGIDEIGSRALSVAYPNPADNYTVIGYVAGSKNARLVVNNLLGATVKDINLAEKQSSYLLNTSDLRTGVYIYSLWLDGRMVASRKLVVNHR